MIRQLGLVSVVLALSACNGGFGLQGSEPASEPKAYEIHHNDDEVGRVYFPKHIESTGKKVFIFDPREPAWAAYDADGDRVKTGRASGGKGFCADLGSSCLTVVGEFRVHAKRGPSCVSNKFPLGKGGAPMPNCMFFHRGFAMHGSYNVPRHNASHGCIRLLPSAAAWLDNNFIDIGTKVIVRSY